MGHKPTPEMQRFLISLAGLGVALLVFFGVVMPSSEDPVEPLDNELLEDLEEDRRDMFRRSLSLTRRSLEPEASSVPEEKIAEAKPQPTPIPQGSPEPSPSGGDRGDVEGRIQSAIEMIDSGRIDEAMAKLEGVLEDDPENEQALVEMAMIHLLDLKQPNKAIGYLQKVMKVNPKNRIVMSELVSLYEEQGRVEEGLSFMQNMQNGEGDPSGEISYGIGQMLAMQGREAEAIPHLEKAAKNGKASVHAYRDLAEAYSQNGEREKAIGAFDRAIDKQRQEIQEKVDKGLPVTFAEERLNYTRMDKARALIEMGSFDQAERVLQSVEQSMPDNERVMALREAMDRKRAG